MNFTSDNAAPACAEVMQHLLECNDGNFMAFEQDPISRGLPDKLNDIFSTKVNVFPVVTGSAAGCNERAV